MTEGKLIIVEGGDGSGKTTFLNALRKKYPDFLYLKEPGGDGGGVAMALRTFLLSTSGSDVCPSAQFSLFWSSKFDSMQRLIRPALFNGRTVVTDRFDASTYAYQISQSQQLEDLFWYTREVCFQDIVPWYLYFDISYEVAKERLYGRGKGNHFDEASEEFHRSVDVWYHKFIRDARVRSVSVNADQPVDAMIADGFKTVDQIIE